MTDINKLLTKKEAELSKLKSALSRNKSEKKKKEKILKDKNYDGLESKPNDKLTDNEKTLLNSLTKIKKQVDGYDGIFTKYNGDIAKLVNEITDLRKNGAKASTSKTGAAAGAATMKTQIVKKCKNNKCLPKPKVQFLGNICITIDHFGFGFAKTSLQVVKELRDIKNRKGESIIPVTVFVQCTKGDKKLMKSAAYTNSKKLSRQKIATFTENDLDMIRKMKLLGVKIGVHLLGRNDVDELNNESATQKQIDNIEYMKSVPEVGHVRVASYHGNKIEEVAGLQNTNVQNSFLCIRGTSFTKPKELTNYTTVSYSLGDIKINRVTHFFFHSHETIGNNLYNGLLEGVQSGKYKAVTYFC